MSKRKILVVDDDKRLRDLFNAIWANRDSP